MVAVNRLVHVIGLLWMLYVLGMCTTEKNLSGQVAVFLFWFVAPATLVWYVISPVLNWARR